MTNRSVSIMFHVPVHDTIADLNRKGGKPTLTKAMQYFSSYVQINEYFPVTVTHNISNVLTMPYSRVYFTRPQGAKALS